DGVDTYMPSVALAPDGSIGMTYLESSPGEDIAMYVTGRTPADPPGTMEPAALVKSGEQFYQGTRVGDFSGIMVDPTTGTSFWAVNEYAIATPDISLPNWGTWIANFDFSSSAGAVKGFAPGVPPAQGAGQKKEHASPGFLADFTHGNLGWERGHPRLTFPASHTGKNSAGHGSIPPPRLGPGGSGPKVKLGPNFAGLDTNDAGGIVEPPDPIAAAGPTAVVEVVNSNIAFYNKANGKSLFSEGLDAFFAPVDQVDVLFSDVYVTYDEQAGRFFVSTMDI